MAYQQSWIGDADVGPDAQVGSGLSARDSLTSERRRRVLEELGHEKLELILWLRGIASCRGEVLRDRLAQSS
ncbi:MAG: hypothetical protein ACYC1P_05630 [Gaiellaceae bacterium]